MDPRRPEDQKSGGHDPDSRYDYHDQHQQVPFMGNQEVNELQPQHLPTLEQQQRPQQEQEATETAAVLVFRRRKIIEGLLEESNGERS